LRSLHFGLFRGSYGIGSTVVTIFVAIQSYHAHTQTHAFQFSVTFCPPLHYFQNLLKTIPRSFGLYYIYLSYINSKISSDKTTFFQNPPHRIWSPSIQLFNHCWVSCSVVKLSGREFGHSLSSNAEVKSEWIYTSASPCTTPSCGQRQIHVK